jgi:GNAT superfamily N-acetyltransferase
MRQINEMVTIFPAQEGHIPLILRFIWQLAEYERLASKVVATEEVLRESLFGANPKAEVVVAYFGDETAGFAVFFHNFSTFAGRAGIYLEDLFVEPQFRRHGIGKALLAHLAKLTKERNCARLEWAVLDWNTPAIRFYKSLGAEAMDDWTVYRVSGAELDKLALTASA